VKKKKLLKRIEKLEGKVEKIEEIMSQYNDRWELIRIPSVSVPQYDIVPQDDSTASRIYWWNPRYMKTTGETDVTWI
jgi:hypothetical protein